MLFIITGASGVGKSSLVPELKKYISKNYSIVDFDELGDTFDGTEDWKEKLLRNMFSLVKNNYKKNIHSVVCGLIQPQWITISDLKYPEIEVYYILLTVSKEQRKIRLMKCKAPLDLIDDEEELHSFPHWIKKFASAYHIIDTTNFSISEISVEVFNIIHTVSSRIPY